MAVTITTGGSTLQAVDNWVRQGLELRQKLEAEQAQLQKRLQEIERALAELPEAPLNPDETTSGGEDDASTPKKVLAVLQEAEGPLTATQVIEAIRKADGDIDPMLVHSALYRLVRREEVLAEGSKGKKTYRMQPPPLEGNDIPF